MDEELISKKDLLAITNISYGQLYRWKRKSIIPEEWFIKKSVSTGQETFFPREKILERINAIIELKDDISLDELAEKFSNTMKNISLLKSYIMEQNIVSEVILKKYEEFSGELSEYDERNLFSLIIFKELLESGQLSIEESKNIAVSAREAFDNIHGKDYKLKIRRKLGVCFYYLCSDSGEFFYDNESVEIKSIDLTKVLEYIKKISSIGTY